MLYHCPFIFLPSYSFLFDIVVVLPFFSIETLAPMGIYHSHLLLVGSINWSNYWNGQTSNLALVDECHHNIWKWARCGHFFAGRHLHGFDTEITIEFAHGLSSLVARLRGIEVLVIEEAIAWVTGLPIEGEWWFNHRLDYIALKDEFVQGTNEQLQGSSKGDLRNSLAKPWKHINLCIQKYLTYEGRHQLLYGYHFQLLVHMRHERYVNVPYFLWMELMCNKV